MEETRRRQPQDPRIVVRPPRPSRDTAARWGEAAGRGYSLARRFVAGLFEHNAFQAAGSIAFWFFLSLIPLLIFGGWLLGQVARSRGVDALIAPALDLAPPSAEGLLRKELERMAGASAIPVGPLSIAGFLWTASAGFHNLMDVFEIAVRAHRRTWWQKRLIAVGWVVLGLGVACGLAWGIVAVDARLHGNAPAASGVVSGGASATLSATASPGRSPSPTAMAGPAPSASAGAGRTTPGKGGGQGRTRRPIASVLHGPGERAVAAIVLLLVGTTILAGFYRFGIRHPAGVVRRAWPGAMAAVVFWVLVSWAFGKYVASLGDYAIYYGSLAAVATLLVWLYLTSLSLVVGAEVNAQLEGIRERRRT